MEYWKNKGDDLINQNNDEAIECYNKALKINPNCADLYANKGVMLYLMEEY